MTTSSTNMCADLPLARSARPLPLPFSAPIADWLLPPSLLTDRVHHVPPAPIADCDASLAETG